MNLYFFPGACSLAPHIALREAGLTFALKRVDLSTGRVDGGGDFRTINPKGYVPALELDDGQVLTENVVLLQYIADRNPSARLAPPAGTMERYRLMEWLSFINSELHKGFSPLFSQTAGQEVMDYARGQVAKRLDYLQSVIRTEYLMGGQFAVADAYLFTVLGWAQEVSIDLARWPALQAFQAHVGSRPCVKEALASES